MFETAVVHARAADRRLLTISVVFHSAVVVAVVVAGVSSTRLPDEAPKQMMPFVYRPVPLMIAPAAQPRTAAAPPKGTAGQARLPVLHSITAPAVIPATIPTLTTPTSLLPSTDSRPSGPIGSEIGQDDSTGNDPTAPAAHVSGPVSVGTAGVTSPVAIRKVEPAYPQVALRAHMTGWVVLQCIIDKSGHIRDVSVVHSSFAAFDQPAIDAVQQWTFRPGTLNGEPVDVIFELTVRFQLR